MFFKDKVHPSEVVKWGIVAGLFEGLYIGLAAILYSKKMLFEALAGGWPVVTTFILIVLITVSAIVTSLIVFAHPIYSLIQKHYRDAILTIIVTLITLFVIIGFIFFAYQNV